MARTESAAFTLDIPNIIDWHSHYAKIMMEVIDKYLLVDYLPHRTTFRIVGATKV